ncbi:SpaA isopeptide-forming pilin-related protein [Frisingicoccus sp.]|uniref:SpaA isopeptide-forming pilin-related protein n=1 Tax=Frisingicoccus sp. TaxID=1918627 RepID=UPI002EAAB61A|nr:prealbumin-like fold domain-containing protein [Frisingicoccus sp.]
MKNKKMLWNLVFPFIMIYMFLFTFFFNSYALESGETIVLESADESQIQESTETEKKETQEQEIEETIGDSFESSGAGEKKPLSPDAIKEVLGKEYWILTEEQIGMLDDAGYDVSGFFHETEGNLNLGNGRLRRSSTRATPLPLGTGEISWDTSTDAKIYTFGGNSYWSNGAYVSAYQTHKYITYNGVKQNIYCVQPYTGSPSQGVHDVYALENENMVKILYYGYGGPGYSSAVANIYSRVDPYYSAFASGMDEAYYLLTHCLAALTYEDPNWSYGLSQSAADTVLALNNYISSLPSPNTSKDIAFSQPHGTYVFVNGKGEYECPTIYVEGNSEDYILFTVPEGTTFRDGGGNTRTSGETVKLYGGTVFCLTAPETKVNGTYTGTFQGVMKKYRSAIVYDTQNLVFLNPYLDENIKTSIRIDWPEDKGSIVLKKTSSNPEMTANNRCYSLQGAVYAVYNSNNVETGRITTDASGSGKLENLPNGVYTVKEITAPLGYKMNKSIYTVTLAQGKDETLYVKDEPRHIPLEVLAKKIDGETGKAEDGKMAGAEFEVKYYDVKSDKDPALSGNKPLRTWILKTDAKGVIRLEQSYKVSGDEFYMNDSAVTLPEGTITIQEIKAPVGYLINDTMFIKKVTVGESDSVPVYSVPIVEEMPHYVSITLTKTIHAEDINFDNGNPMFTFKVDGTDVRGEHRTCYQILNFTEEYVKTNTDADGNVHMAVTFDKLIAGQYKAMELDTSRYSLEKIYDVKNGTIHQSSVIFSLTALEKREGRATFVNDNYEQQDFSDTQMVINSLKKQ